MSEILSVIIVRFPKPLAGSPRFHLIKESVTLSIFSGKNSNIISNIQGMIPFSDPFASYRAHKAEIDRAIQHVLDSGWYVLGSEVEEFEKEFAEFHGNGSYAIGVANGTDAIALCLRSLGLRNDDEVITTSHTAVATVAGIEQAGCKPVFADIDPATRCIDPASVEKRITRNTKAIMPVHIYGQPCDMEAICKLAQNYQLEVVEDCSQAHGAEIDGQKVGTFADISAYSCYPTKNLGGFGDAGMVTTNNPELADKVRLLANHGMRPRYYHQTVGINSRLDSIQAAILGVKATQLDTYGNQRAANAGLYHEMMSATGLSEILTLPHQDERCGHVWNQFTVRVPNGQRDQVRSQLAEKGIGTEIYYPVPLHEQECYQYLGYEKGSLPETERAAGEVLSLPIFPELHVSEIETVVDALGEALGCQDRLKQSA